MSRRRGSAAMTATLTAGALAAGLGCAALPLETVREAAERAAEAAGTPGGGDRERAGGTERAPRGEPERRLLAAVNRERSRRGLAALRLDDRLSAAAAAHSRAMAERGFFDHCDPDTGTQVWDRVEDAGYLWRAIGENVAAGWGDPDEVLESWLDSRGHRKNLLREEFVEAGIGYAPDPDDRRGVRLDEDEDCAPDGRGGPYRHYWTMVFAAPSRSDAGG